MKTLNDYIKESLLDDEDVLVNNVRKDSQNWLLTIKNMLEQDCSAEDILKFLNSKIVTDSIKPMFKKFENMQWKYGKNPICSHCTLFNKKERKIYGTTYVIEFVYYFNEKSGTITGVRINIPEFDDLPNTTRNNIIINEYYKWFSTLFNEYGLYKTKMQDVYKI